MRKLKILALLILCPLAAFAQNPVQQEEAESVDMTYAGQPAIDSSLAGKSIFNVLKSGNTGRAGKVEVVQSPAVAKAMENHIARNASKKMHGYRIRIFFDNGQNARAKSESVVGAFSAQHPGVGVYRDYENPYFRVTVGDFRTRRDATRFLNSIKWQYPTGFIVKETIKYPML